MKPIVSHPWKLSQAEAVELQKSLASVVQKEDRFQEPIRYVAGVDVAYSETIDQLVAAAVVLDADTLDCVESVVIRDSVQFPYIPGLFSFRELPPIAKALELLKHAPQLIVCDGQGLAHPRRFGLANHLGVLFDCPTIGCGKTRLIGEYAEPASPRGSTSPLMDGDEVVGRVVRTQTGIKPLFLSVGHRISLDTACEWILKLAPTYRQPETTRQADQLVRKHSLG